MAGGEQHFAEKFFPLDVARIGNAAEGACVVDQHFPAWVEDRVHTVWPAAGDSLNDASRVLVANIVYLQHYVIFIEKPALLIEPPRHLEAWAIISLTKTHPNASIGFFGFRKCRIPFCFRIFRGRGIVMNEVGHFACRFRTLDIRIEVP